MEAKLYVIRIKGKITEMENAQEIMLEAVISIGQDLIEAKELIEHGAWGNWLKNNFGLSSSSAQKYMKVSREYAGIPKSERVKGLGYTKALKLLMIDIKSREAFLRTHNVESITVKELARKIKEAIALEK